MNKNNYDLSNFDEYLLAKDNSVKDFGWMMVINSFNVKTMNLDKLTMLKLRITQKKYTPDTKLFKWSRDYYININKINLTKSIEKRLKRFSENNKLNAFHRAQKLIKQEYVNKTNSI